MRMPGQIGALIKRVLPLTTRRRAMTVFATGYFPSAGEYARRAREATQPSADGGAYENYCCRDCNCTGARACALACFGGSVDTGLRAALATGSGGLADVAAMPPLMSWPQVLLGGAGDRARHLFLVRLELFGDPSIFAGQFFLAGLELFDLLLHACEITRHRLERLCHLGWDRGGCRVLRHGLSRR